MRVSFALTMLLLLHAFTAGAVHISGTEDPQEFFEKVAGAFLKEELGLDLHHIQVYPSNRYSPEVHRLLQVTANLYDCTTNRGDNYPWFPTCFRPRFSTNQNEVFVSGYVEEIGINFSDRPWHDVQDSNDRPIGADDNVYGIPIIIGAKKGFPNFNEFVVQSAVQFSRKLELRKTVPWDRPTETNQMIIIGVSNTVALELWNPWTKTYPRPLTVKIGARITLAFTNENGFGLTNTGLHGILTNIPAAQLTNGAFSVPLLATDIALTNSAFRSLPSEHFDPIIPTTTFERGAGFPTNLWGLATKTRAIVLISDGEHLIDFVALSDLATEMNVSAGLVQMSNYDFWNVTPAAGANAGVLNQLHVSLGTLYIGDWRNYQLTPPRDQEQAIQQFLSFFQSGTNTNLVMEAPFVPSRRIFQSTAWEANDPFLHQTSHQLLGRFYPSTTINIPSLVTPLTITNGSSIGRRNRGYSPSIVNADLDPFAYDGRVKDITVYSPDWWTFDVSRPLNLANIGRVHRGTPWQSIYLKSGIIPPDEWLSWYGSLSGHPTNDWQLVSILASMLDTNAPQTLLSINSTNRDAWAAAFDGLIVTTNDEECSYFDSTVHSNSPQVSIVLNGLEASRASSPGGYFDDIGAVLATPELSMSSPWINFAWWWVDCLPDAALEAIPSQLLSKLRPDPVGRLVPSSNGSYVIQFRVIPDHRYEVEASSDLRTWQSVSTNFVSETSFQFSESPNLDHQFYRLKLVP
jgi:hypothetical protein